MIDSDIHFCPDDTFVDIWLTNPGDPDIYESTLAELTTPWQGLTPPAPYFKTVDEAIGLTIDEFYQIYKEPTDQCLDSPYAIWPFH